MGKTLLAKAIAGQAGVPFYNSTGADLQGMFVGVGAARVRDMFERARKNAPCVLFIDEFDGVGQARSAASSASEENVQTINQLLTELDGFEDNTGVLHLQCTTQITPVMFDLKVPVRMKQCVMCGVRTISCIERLNGSGLSGVRCIHSSLHVVSTAPGIFEIRMCAENHSSEGQH